MPWGQERQETSGPLRSRVGSSAVASSHNLLTSSPGHLLSGESGIERSLIGIGLSHGQCITSNALGSNVKAL